MPLVHLSVACANGRTDGLNEVVYVVEVHRDEVGDIYRGEICKTEENPDCPPEQDIVHDEKWHLGNEGLNGIPPDKESALPGHQVEYSRCHKVDDGHRQNYHYCDQRHDITARGSFLLVIIWDNILNAQRRLVYVYFIRFHIQFINITNMPAMA